MKIAIIGAGFSGLGACYHLLQQHAHDVTIFEASKIGGGASGVSSGLLNPYFGEHGRLSFRAREGLLETKKLLAVASKALGKPVSKPGIIHVSANAKQCISWKDHPNRFDDVKSLNISDYNFYFPFEQPRIFIESAETVFPALYLEGLWRACKNLGAKLIQAKISHSRELLEYDKVLFAVGGAIKDFEEGKDLSLKFVKGQSLYCKKPEDLPIINHSTVAKGHVAISPDPNYFYLGSTYEHDFASCKPEEKIAKEKIFPQAKTYFPRCLNLDVVSCHSGIRVVSLKNYHPIIDQIGPKHYAITAMGSRGLLYHALLGKVLAELITKSVQ